MQYIATLGDAGDWVSACRNMANIVGNAEKGWPKKRWNEVVKDDLKKCSLDRGFSERQGEMEGSNYGENVRPERARTSLVRIP